MNFSM